MITAGAASLERKALVAIKKYEIAPKKTLVGFSGGADSTALLHFLVSVWGRENVSALHVNHHIRGDDALHDENFCRAFCDERGIEFFCADVDVLSECGGVAVEETARRLRYAALAERAEKIGADAIALAHTANDNAETFIFNAARGCGISGLGIPPVRNNGGAQIVRPLILCTRGDVEEYVKRNALPHVTDKTNFDSGYSRNFIRASIIPLVENVNAGAIKNISELSERARIDENFINAFAENHMLSESRYELSELKKLHEAVLSRVLMKMSAEVDCTPSRAHIDAMISLVFRGRTGNVVELPDGCSAIVADGKLRFFGRGERARDDVAPFSFDASCGVSCDTLGFSVSLEKPENSANTRIFSAALPRKDISALTVRSKRSGDAYRFGGMTRTVKKLTSGVPFDARRRRPVFERGGEILWYPGYPVADGVRKDANAAEIYYIEKIF